MERYNSQPQYKLPPFLFVMAIGLCAFPAHAAKEFSYIEFHIALIIGIVLPIILIAISIQKSLPNLWQFLFASTTSLIILLLVVDNLAQYSTAIVLSLTTLFLSSIHLWQFFKRSQSTENAFGSRLMFNILCISTASYIVIIWLLPAFDAFIGWVLFALIVLIVSTFHLIMCSRTGISMTSRWIVWLFSGLYGLSVFMWLNAQITTFWLVLSSVGLFLVATIIHVSEFIRRLQQSLYAEKPSIGNNENTNEIYTFIHDPATNLPSYQQALFRLDKIVKAEPKKRFAIIVIKPINFDQVNHVLGHQNSDILLLQLAYCLQKYVAENDSLINFDLVSQPTRIARLQSLRFMLVMDVGLYKYPERVMIDTLCQQLAKAVPEALSFKSFTLSFQLACGVSFTNEHGNTIPEVVSHAEDAVIEAEKNHKLIHYFDNNASLYTEKQLVKMERLKQAITDDKLDWTLEPIIEIDTFKIKGFELNVVWQLEQNQRFNIMEFIDIAEHSGEAYLLGKQMIKKAFHSLHQLNKQGIQQTVSVNLPSKEMLEPDIVEYIEKQIVTFGVSADHLMFELTEPVMLGTCSRAKNTIDQLRSLGVGISINDFSGNYESLRYIRKLSINQIKINCSLLSKDDSTRAEKAIVNSLINLARTMKLPFIGNQVDTKEVLEIYKLMGGSVVQGAGVAPCIALDDIEPWIKRWYMQHPSAEERSNR